MFKLRVRVILILLFGGLVMVATRLFYLQIVCGDHYRAYAENVRVDTRATEASRGRLRAASGELLAFDEPAYDVAIVPSRLPEWRPLCDPVLRLYRLDRRERIVSLRDATVLVAGGPARRGYEVSFGFAATFLRRRDTELVRSDEHGSARVVVPRETAELVDAVAALAKAPAQDMLQELFAGLALVGRGWQRLSSPIVVAREVGFLPAAEIDSNADRYPGFEVVPRARRSYPYEDLACHLLGYTQRVSAAEYARWRESYNGSKAKRFLPDDLIGRSGAERALDFQLRAARGTQTVEVDAALRTQRILEGVPAVQGADVCLTIDREVQAAAQAALEGQIGAIVVMEPATGRLLAMASAPGYNANELPLTTPDPRAPMLNRAIQGTYPLGSAFKLILAVGALEEGKVLPQIECTGEYLGHHCIEGRAHGAVNLRDALRRSCNVYFYRTANEMLGIRGVARWAALFGLGQPTGVNLPDEKPGTLPNPAWKYRHFKESWFRGDTCNLAIGQGYLEVTPLQVARVVAAIANGGRLVRPRLVDRIVRPDGSAEPLEEDGDTTLPVSPATLAAVRDAMHAVCHEHGGTAYRAWARSESQPDWVEEQGYAVAGKTSTAQWRGNSVLWFVGFAPYRDPRVAFVVALEHEGGNAHGGDVAAPLARRILARLPERYLDGVPGRELRQRARQRVALGGMRP